MTTVAIALVAVAAAACLVAGYLAHSSREARQAADQMQRDSLRAVERVVSQAHAERADLTNRFMFLMGRRYDDLPVTALALPHPMDGVEGNGLLLDPENSLGV
jgi:hypothetical protein